MGSKSGTLYTGMTNNLFSRVMQHRAKETPGFTARYDVTRLVFYETLATALAAIRREKQIKGWTRKKKIALIESVNPRWKDLSEGWGEFAGRPTVAGQRSAGGGTRPTVWALPCGCRFGTTGTYPLQGKTNTPLGSKNMNFVTVWIVADREVIQIDTERISTEVGFAPVNARVARHATRIRTLVVSAMAC